MILDTNALSAWAEGNPACRSAFAEAQRLLVPSIVLGEYLYGIRQSRYRSRYEQWLAANLPMAISLWYPAVPLPIPLRTMVSREPSDGRDGAGLGYHGRLIRRPAHPLEKSGHSHPGQ